MHTCGWGYPDDQGWEVTPSVILDEHREKTFSGASMVEDSRTGVGGRVVATFWFLVGVAVACCLACLLSFWYLVLCLSSVQLGVVCLLRLFILGTQYDRKLVYTSSLYLWSWGLCHDLPSPPLPFLLFFCWVRQGMPLLKRVICFLIARTLCRRSRRP